MVYNFKWYAWEEYNDRVKIPPNCGTYNVHREYSKCNAQNDGQIVVCWNRTGTARATAKNRLNTLEYDVIGNARLVYASVNAIETRTTINALLLRFFFLLNFSQKIISSPEIFGDLFIRVFSPHSIHFTRWTLTSNISRYSLIWT